MLKKLLSYLVFGVLFVIVFNLLDFIFDRFVSFGPFTFDTLSNLILPLVLAALVILYIAKFKKYVLKSE